MVNYLLVFIMLIVLIVGMFVGMAYFPEPYKLRNDGGNCSIGKPEIAGDYTVDPDNKNPLNSGDSRRCAIKDCKEYNNYQKLIKSNSTCVV